jgi:hypothetical protein
LNVDYDERKVDEPSTAAKQSNNKGRELSAEMFHKKKHIID